MKTLLVLILTAFSLAASAANYCDAVTSTTAHPWGVQIDIVSISSVGQDCFFGIAVAPAPGETATPTKLRWILSRNEPSPTRFATDKTCSVSGIQLNCGFGLKAGATATILGVRAQGDVGLCYSATLNNISVFSGAGGLEQRATRLICLPN